MHGKTRGCKWGDMGVDDPVEPYSYYCVFYWTAIDKLELIDWPKVN